MKQAHGSRDERTAAFERECRSRGLALTVQRRTVFEELEGRHDHPTADQVYESAHDRLPSLSRTTVYRVLETLVETGFARKVHHPDSVVPPVPIPEVEGTGFRIRDYSVSFNGLCRNCH
jgi:Fe2+ or Zn2+ uptake regulation protein